MRGRERAWRVQTGYGGGAEAGMGGTESGMGGQRPGGLIKFKINRPWL